MARDSTLQGLPWVSRVSGFLHACSTFKPRDLNAEKASAMPIGGIPQEEDGIPQEESEYQEWGTLERLIDAGL